MVSLDWIRIGWGQSMSKIPSTTAPMIMDFSVISENTEILIDVTIAAIHQIAIDYPAPFTLMVSGGVDSQAMLYAWLKSNVPFRILSVVYVDRNGIPMNTHDLETLKTFTSLHSLKVEYKTFSILDFIENELVNYVIAHQCTSPQICTHMRISEMVDSGTLLFSGNIYNGSPNMNYTIFGMHRYMVNTGRSIIPFFFIHDPKMVGAFYHFQLTYVDNLTNPSDSVYAKKCNKIKLAGFEVIPQDYKMTGFEKVKEYYDNKPELINTQDKLEFAKFPSKRIFDLRYRYSFTRTINYVDDIINIPPKRIT